MNDKNNKHHALLIKNIANEDRDALNELYVIYQPKLFEFCYEVLNHDLALAADVADKTMQEIWRSAYNFTYLSEPSRWIYTIAKYQIINILREKMRTLPSHNIDQLSIEIMNVKSKAETLIHTNNEHSFDNIKHLSEQHREIIKLVYLKRLSIKNISEMLNLSEDTIKSRMLDARKNLQKTIQNNTVITEKTNNDTSKKYCC